MIILLMYYKGYKIISTKFKLKKVIKQISILLSALKYILKTLKICKEKYVENIILF